MKKNLYSIYDSKAKQYQGVYAVDFEAQILRDLTSIVNGGSNSPYCMFSEDFQLIKIGTFETETGLIQSCLETICKLDTLKKVVKYGEERVREQK